MFSVLLIPATSILAAGGGGGEEAAHAEPVGMVYYVLATLSFLTIIYMIYLSIRDNG